MVAAMNAAASLHEAARLVARLDSDFATVENGVGYSKSDGSFGHMLAETPPEAWTPPVTRAAWLMLRRYRTQLSRHGIDVDAIPEPEGTSESRVMRVVDVRDGRFVLGFTYDLTLIQKIKRLPGRRWEQTTKTWTAPHSDALVALVAAEAFQATSRAADAFAAPPPPVATAVGSVAQDGPRLVIRCGYDPALVAAIKEIPGRRWDPVDRAWTTPISSIATVREFAEQYALTWNVADDVEAGEDNARPSITVQRGQFQIAFDYNRDLVAAVRDLPGARWDRGRWVWTVPLSAAVDVHEFITATESTIDPSAEPHLRDARAALARIAESAATDADIDIPGLGGVLMPFQRAGVAYALRALGFAPTSEGRWVQPVTV